MEDDLISRKLFVTAPGLDFTDTKALKDKCEIHGVVEEVNLFTEKRCLPFFLLSLQVIVLEEKNYGFVTFTRKVDALAALDALSGCLINGKKLMLRRKKRTSGDTSSDFSSRIRFGSHRKSQVRSNWKNSDFGGSATFACFTCGRQGHKKHECPVKFSDVTPTTKYPEEDFKVFVENLPPVVQWQEVRDYFESEVGPVSYAMPRFLESGSEGCGIVGFERRADQELAVLKMDGKLFMGKTLRVKAKAHSRAKGNQSEAILCSWCAELGYWCGRSGKGCFPVDWETLQRAVATVAACLTAKNQLEVLEHKTKANIPMELKMEEYGSESNLDLTSNVKARF